MRPRSNSNRGDWVSRFWARTRPASSGCVEWTGSRTWSGYGRITAEGRRTTAHRVAWLLRHGEWPPDHLCVMHSCDNRLCVNHEHLSLGDRLDNAADMVAKGRNVKGSSHGMATIPEPIIKAAFRMIDDGVRPYLISRYLGVSQATVCDLRHGRRWTHLMVVA